MTEEACQTLTQSDLRDFTSPSTWRALSGYLTLKLVVGPGYAGGRNGVVMDILVEASGAHLDSSTLVAEGSQWDRFADGATATREHVEIACTTLAKIRSLDTASPRRALRELYRSIDALLRASRFAACDEILGMAIPANLSLEVALGLLSITFVARNKLPARPAYFVALRRHLLGGMSEKEVQEVLFGLE